MNRLVDLGEGLILLSVPTSEPTITSRLSHAEREVARLAARGLSNAAIASLRRCSPRTVANHLARAYVKLGISGRRELRRLVP